MDSSTSPSLLPFLITLFVLLAIAVAAVLFIRKARSTRARQLDQADDVSSLALKKSKSEAHRGEERADDDESEDEEGIAELPALPHALPVPVPARAPHKGAQILPFPKTPAPVSQPVSQVFPEVAAERAPVAHEPIAPVAPIPVAPPSSDEPERRKKDIAGLKTGLARTRSGWIARLGQLFSGKKTIDPALVDEIEKVLLTADIGVRTSQKLLEEIRASLNKKELTDPDAVWAFLRARCRAILNTAAPLPDFSTQKPFVLLVVGVNGSGKTTTIGKLASKLKGEGRSVLLGAGDTFRAAAVEQLEIWGTRTGVPVVRGKEGADPSSVLFDAVKRAKAEGVDVAILDTAGRLQTKVDLMQELQKVRRVLTKAHESAPHETWLVIDSTMGQNAISQAQIFTEAMQVTGIVLTKLDGTAKGGVIIGIADQLGLPVRYIGVGERVEDLRPFDPDEFVDALFAPEDSLN